MSEQNESVCKNCNRQFIQQNHKKGGSKHLYCSDACRMAYHKQQIHLQRLAAYEQKPEKSLPELRAVVPGGFGRGHRQRFCCAKCK